MATGELFLLQEEPFVSLWSLKMKIFGFWTDRDWSQKSYYGNNTKGAICFCGDEHLWCQVSNVSRDVVYSVFTTFTTSNLHNRKTLISLK